MKMLNTMNFDNAKRMTALAIALVFCAGMFAPMANVAGGPELVAETQADAIAQESSMMASSASEPPVIMAAPEPVEPDTVLLQPNATVGKDTMICTQHPGRPYGEWGNLLAGNGSFNFRPLLEFDAPESGTLLSATLSLYAHSISGDPVNLTVHPATSPWWEGVGYDDVILGASNWTHRMGGTYYRQDFETDDGGFIGNNDWEWGAYSWAGVIADPPYEPPSAHSGTNMWGTVLNNEYNNLGNTSTLAFTTSLVGLQNPQLTFWDWYDVYETFDHGEVYVNGNLVLDRDTAYNIPTVWTQQTIDLSAYANLPEVAIEFRMYATTVVSRAGWYIDDVAILSDMSVPWDVSGGDYDSSVGSYQTFNTPDGWCNWNVTEIVRDWMDGTHGNNGFIIVSDNPNPAQINLVWFHSSDSADARFHPKLTISYAAEITDPVPAQTFTEDGPARIIPLSGRGTGSVEHVSDTPTTNNLIPFWGELYNTAFYHNLYTPSQVGSEGIISRIGFLRSNPDDPVNGQGYFQNLRISMAHTTLSDITTAFDTNYQGFMTEVFPTQDCFINSSNGDPWVYFDLNQNFTYDSQYNLLVNISWAGDGGTNVRLQAVDTGVFSHRAYRMDALAPSAGNLGLVAKFLVDVADNAVVRAPTAECDQPFPRSFTTFHHQSLYNYTLINQSGTIDKLRFQKAITPTEYLTMQNVVIRLAHSNNDSLGTVFDAHRDGAWTPVLNVPSLNLSGMASGWVTIDIDNNFTYDGVRNLLVDIQYDGWQSPVGLTFFTANVSTVENCILWSGSLSDTTGLNQQWRPSLGVVFLNSASLSWSATSSNPAMFTASVSGRNLIITPQPNQFGTGSVTLRLTNSNGEFVTQNIPVTINAVNDAPVLAALPDQTCVEDISKTVNLVSYMSDVDDNVYSLIVTENSVYVVVNGTNLTFLYPEGVVSDTVSLTISDLGGLTATSTFNVAVTQINDPPEFTSFQDNVTCDATVDKHVSLTATDEETAPGQLEFQVFSEYANITGHTLNLLFPKGVHTAILTVYLLDNTTYGTRNNVSRTVNVTIIDHPEVTNGTPTGASVPIVNPVQATFDMPMNASKAEAAFSMMFGTTSIAGNFTWNTAGTVMTFTPESFMLAGNYTVTIAASAESSGGVSMLSAYSWPFTVVYGDYDGDGMPDEYEIGIGLDPTVDDSAGDLDGDGMPNDYEFENDLDPATDDAAADDDGDGMPNLYEYENDLDPQVNDADGDADGDGLPNIYEFQNDLDPGVDDADGDADDDGYTNLEEYLEGTDPNDPESAPADFAWIIMVLVLVAVIAVVLVVVMLMRKKKPAPAPEYQEGNYPPPPPPTGEQPYYPPPEQPPVEPESAGDGPAPEPAPETDEI